MCPALNQKRPRAVITSHRRRFPPSALFSSSPPPIRTWAVRFMCRPRQSPTHRPPTSSFPSPAAFFLYSQPFTRRISNLSPVLLQRISRYAFSFGFPSPPSPQLPSGPFRRFNVENTKRSNPRLGHRPADGATSFFLCLPLQLLPPLIFPWSPVL